MVPTKIQVSWLFGSGKEAKQKKNIDFQGSGHCSYLGFPIGMILVIFYQHVISMLPTTSHPDASYRVSSQLVFRFRREAKK